MTSMLRASSLATFAATFLAFGAPAGAFDDARRDWDGYSWQTIKLAECVASQTTLDCPAYHQKWDWKRNQWVDMTITLDLAHDTLKLTQRLTDNDPNDDDNVCVTALAVDGHGNNIVAHHQNWHVAPGSVYEASFAYHAPALAEVAVIHIGSKQCREGPAQDDALYAQVLAGIHS